VKIKILSVGRQKSDPVSPLVDDYVARIKKFLPAEDIVLKPGPDSKLIARINKEREKSLYIVALDERGSQYTSVKFSSQLSAWMNAGHQTVLFVIGQAAGLPKEIIKTADSTIALSKMTLPHRFARLLLTEQIYRGLCILKNIPYHK
jgi:23S rRNA (pseudouridine1915-N3)-methyltransferase